jgi:uncharacterized protein YjbJ (UPF0337 family)
MRGGSIPARDESAHTGELGRHRGFAMKWYQIAGDWKQFTGLVKAKWGKLTDGDLTTFGGKSAQLADLLQKKYGYAREQAEREIAEFTQKHTA